MYANAFGVSPGTITGAEKVVSAAEVPHLDFSAIRADSLAKLIKSSGKTALSLCDCGPNCYTIANPDRAMTTHENPRLLPNDTLGFDPDAPIRAGDFVLACVEDREEPIVRIFYPHGRHGAAYHALNPAIEALKFSRKNQWVNLARLKFIVRPVETLG